MDTRLTKMRSEFVGRGLSDDHGGGSKFQLTVSYIDRKSLRAVKTDLMLMRI